MTLPDAPGVLLVSLDGSLVAATQEGMAWARTLGLDETDLARFMGGDMSRQVVHLPQGGRACVYISQLAPDISAVVLDRASPVAALPDIAAAHGLTRREQDVLRLLLLGQSDREIAEALVIAVDTAREYTGRVLRKVGVARRAELPARLFPGCFPAAAHSSTTDQGSSQLS